MKRENQRKKLYNDKTKVVPFRCPVKKVEDFKEQAYKILDGYRTESQIINELQSTDLYNVAKAGNLKSNDK